VAITTIIISSQGCSGKLYHDMDYKVELNNGMKARAKSAYKQNTRNSWHLALVITFGSMGIEALQAPLPPTPEHK
jgi:hypothetical protein